jgi:hypothetical protein
MQPDATAYRRWHRNHLPSPASCPEEGKCKLGKVEMAGHSPRLATCAVPHRTTITHGVRLHTRVGLPTGDGLHAYGPHSLGTAIEHRRYNGKQEEAGRAGKQKATIRLSASVRRHCGYATSSNQTQPSRGVWVPGTQCNARALDQSHHQAFSPRFDLVKMYRMESINAVPPHGCKV